MEDKQLTITEARLKYESSKDEFIQSIINSDLSKREQIDLLTHHSLFKVKGSIEEVFLDDYNKYADTLAKPCYIDSVYNEMFSRHSIVYINQLIRIVEDDVIDFIDNNLIVIFTNRRDDTVYSIPFDDFINKAYDWIISNKAIGYKLD